MAGDDQHGDEGPQRGQERRGAGREDEGVGGVALVVAAEAEGALREIDLGDQLELRLRTEAPCLFAHLVDELGALDAVHEAGVVLDLGGDGQLAAGLVALEDDGQAGRTGTEDRDTKMTVWGRRCVRHATEELLSQGDTR